MLVPPATAYFDVCGFHIYYYGIILAFAIFSGVLISNYAAIKYYCLCNVIPNIATSIILGGIVGARLYYCILNYDVYISSPLNILDIRNGGLSIHGAILGGLFVLYYQSRKYKINFLKLCDICSLGLPVAQAIGRWGNFFNSEAFGYPCNLPWKMYIKQPLRPDEYFNNDYFHPTFLYESILNICIFIILYKFILPKYKENFGVITACYFILYSIVRFFVEGFRVDCVKYIGSVPVPQIVSIIFIVISVSFLFYLKLASNHLKRR